jgi:hypothetical protein
MLPQQASGYQECASAGMAATSAATMSTAASGHAAAARSNCLPPVETAATEAIMIAHGFTVEQMVDLVRAGLATAQAERIGAGGRMIEVARVRITEAGRQALTDKPKR